MDYSIDKIKVFLETSILKNWVHKYLAGWGNNSRLSWELANKKTFFLGPKNIPLSLIKRTCGVAGEEYYEDISTWNKKVKFLKEIYASKQYFPPLIIGIEKGKYFLYDGNHRHYLLDEAGITHHTCIIACHSFSDFFDTFLWVKKDFLFTIVDNQGSISPQVDLLTVLLEKELAPYFDIKKVSSSKDLLSIDGDIQSRRPLILFRSSDFPISGSYKYIQVKFLMADTTYGFDIADGVIDSVIKHSFI